MNGADMKLRASSPFLLERLAGGPLRTAHGGAAREAPDNTLESVAAAARRDLDFVEVDVHLTKDDQLLLWHDARFVTPDGAFEIARHTVAELRALKVPDGTLATLPQALELLRGKCGAMLDLKAPGLEGPIEAVLRAQNFFDVLACGGYRDTLRTLKGSLLQIAVTLTPDAQEYRALGQVLQGAPFLDGLTVYWRTVGPAMARLAQDTGALLLAWTVDHPQLAGHVLAAGAHGVTSNNMALLEGLRRRGADGKQSL